MTDICEEERRALAGVLRAYFAATGKLDTVVNRAGIPPGMTHRQVADEVERGTALGERIAAALNNSLDHVGIPVPPAIGARMTDGTVYAGSLDGRDIYTTPEDAVTARWLRRPRLTYTFNGAAKYAEQLNRETYLGHDDWRVPTKGELDVLFNNRAAVGGFDESGVYYWSSSQLFTDYRWAQRFSDGYHGANFKMLDSSLRCVR